MVRNIIATSLAVFCIATFVYAHCHDTKWCEEPEERMLGTHYWENDNNNTATMRCNDSYPNNMKTPSVDAPDAAAEWSSVSFQGNTIPFNITIVGTTTQRAGENDWNSCIGYYGDPDMEDNWVAFTQRWRYANSDRILEADISLNYYLPWNYHGYTSEDEYCLLQVITHEMGHVVGMLDVYYYVGYEENEWNCSEYEHYTMQGYGAPNWHDPESLACEDKYVLDIKYSDDE